MRNNCERAETLCLYTSSPCGQASWEDTASFKGFMVGTELRVNSMNVIMLFTSIWLEKKNPHKISKNRWYPFPGMPVPSVSLVPLAYTLSQWFHFFSISALVLDMRKNSGCWDMKGRRLRISEKDKCFLWALFRMGIWRCLEME